MILFLDIDGVILAGRHWKAGKRERLPPDTIGLLNEVIERTGARIVVSSVWREDRRLRGKLRRAGFKGEFHREWRTPESGRDIPGSLLIQGTCRGDEIADWLQRNPVNRYCIVDDDSDMRPEQKPFFVKTEFEEGLCRERVERIVAILSGAQ